MKVSVQNLVAIGLAVIAVGHGLVLSDRLEKLQTAFVQLADKSAEMSGDQAELAEAVSTIIHDTISENHSQEANPDE